MATMSQDGDSTCPLCAEEMDLTDQQLKPCKCGYEICVWCWHHIMDMAEKDASEGRCPACRTPYDKERIVATTVKCDRMVAEVNAEKKQRSQKSKPKTSAEERKHLNSVRVVQRNLVYIIGLPINLSDESLLERKEYFGQYGKVLKVSISRPGGATTQYASSNNTFSVYITYGREEEAIRCIQSVHNFVLVGKPLRACFGTTKYCHAWLRNMTCSNPDCLYLHDIAIQEDSFSKDEIISAYTRSRVPQMASANLQRRSGNFLPPSVDDISSCMASNKTIPRTSTNNITNDVKSLNCNLGKSTVLPASASWGLRASNCPIPVGSVVCSQTPIAHKAETPVVAAKQDSPWDDDVTASSLLDVSKEVQMDSLSSTSGPLKSDGRRDCQTVSDLSSEVSQGEICASGASAWDDDVLTALNIPEQTPLVHMTGARLAEPAKSSAVMEIRISESDTSSRTPSDASPSSVISVSCPSAHLTTESEGKETAMFVPGSNGNLNSTSHGTLDNGFVPDEAFHNCSEDTRSVQTLCSAISSVGIDRHLMVDHPDLDENLTLGFNFSSAGMAKSLASVERCSPDNNSGDLDKVALTHTSVLSSTHISRELSDWSLESQKQVLLSSGNKIKDPLLTTHDRRQRLSPVNNEMCSSYFNYPFNVRSSDSSLDDDVGQKASSDNEDSLTKNVDKPMLPVREDTSVLYEDKSLSNFCKTGKAFELPVKNFTDQKVNISGRSDDEVNIGKSKISDIPESSIISDILSLDFDPWDDSLSLANDFTKLFGETNREDGSPLLSTSLNSPISNQSRFSFARQENQHNHLESFREAPETQKSLSLLGDSYGDGHQKGNGFNRSEGPYAVNRDPVVSSNEHAGFPRSKISAPPGFSSTSKAPPGFSFPDRCEPTYGTSYAENNLRNTSLGTQYQVQQSDNMADVEFIDPAILAVGRGRMPVGVNNINTLRPAFPVHFTSEADLRFQLLMQQSISSHQRQRIPDRMNDRFLTLNDAYSIPQPLLQNSSSLSQFAHLPRQQPRNSQSFSNHWEGWNNIQTVNDAAMLDSLRNERFGLSNYYTGNEEFKFHVSNADLYGRAFGMQ